MLGRRVLIILIRVAQQGPGCIMCHIVARIHTKLVWMIFGIIHFSHL